VNEVAFHEERPGHSSARPLNELAVVRDQVRLENSIGPVSAVERTSCDEVTFIEQVGEPFARLRCRPGDHVNNQHFPDEPEDVREEVEMLVMRPCRAIGLSTTTRSKRRSADFTRS
jgi:hypothetical protein